MKPVSVIKLAPESMAQVEYFASEIISSVEEGKEDALDLWLKIKGYSEAFEIIKKAIEEKAIEEAGKFGKGEHEQNGFVFRTGETGVKYDYSHTNDPILPKKEQLLVEAQNGFKERTEFLKKLKEPFTMVDENSGEVVKVYPAVKKSKTSLIVQIK